MTGVQTCALPIYNVRACCGGIHDVGSESICPRLLLPRPRSSTLLTLLVSPLTALAGRRHLQHHHAPPPRSHSSASSHHPNSQHPRSTTSLSSRHTRAATQPDQQQPYSAASQSSAALGDDLPARSASPSGFSLRSRGSRRSSVSNTGGGGGGSLFGRRSTKSKGGDKGGERESTEDGRRTPSLVERLTGRD